MVLRAHGRPKPAICWVCKLLFRNSQGIHVHKKKETHQLPMQDNLPIINLPTNYYKEQSSSSEANSSSVSQEISQILCKPRDSLPCSQEPPFAHILSQINPAHTPSLFLENPL